MMNTIQSFRTGPLLALCCLLGFALLGFALLGGPARAEDAAKSEAIGLIQGQLTALATGDRAQAFSFAAPMVQRKFIDADNFMTMVQAAYGVLIRPQAVDFQGFQRKDGRAVQTVMILAGNGTTWMAHYFLLRMDDGSWRIAGCHLEERPFGAV